MDRNLFGEPLDSVPRKKRRTDPEKRRWENQFQKWCDEKGHDGYTHYGACGYGVICNYCDGIPEGRTCVRALNTMIQEKRKKINYETTTFEDAFDGSIGG